MCILNWHCLWSIGKIWSFCYDVSWRKWKEILASKASNYLVNYKKNIRGKLYQCSYRSFLQSYYHLSRENDSQHTSDQKQTKSPLTSRSKGHMHLYIHTILNNKIAFGRWNFPSASWYIRKDKYIRAILNHYYQLKTCKS